MSYEHPVCMYGNEALQALNVWCIKENPLLVVKDT